MFSFFHTLQRGKPHIGKERSVSEFEPQDKRAAPRDWREYVASFRETVRVYRWIAHALVTPRSRPWMRRFGIALVAATLFHGITPRLVSFIFDGVEQKNFWLIALGLGGFVLLSAGAARLADYYQAVAREWLAGINWSRFDDRITALFFEKSMGQHIQESSILNVGNIDKGRWKVLDLHAVFLFDGIPEVLTLLVAYLFLWFLSPAAGGIMTAVIAMYLAWMLFLNQRVMAVCLPIDRNFRRLNRHRLERWEKIERVKTSAKEREELAEMRECFDTILASDRGFWIWFIRQATIRGALNLVGVSCIMGYGSWLAWRGELSLGLLYPLFAWSWTVSDRIWQIGHLEHLLNWNMPAVKSMINALSLPPDVTDKPDAVEFKADGGVHVVFDNVSHTYPKGSSEEGNAGEKAKEAVLKRVSFEIRPGEKVALIGASGAGKTTIMRLLLRFMDPDEGRIIVNGRDLRDLALESWLRAVGYIAQQAHILDGTIRYNLTYAISPQEREALSDDKLWEVMRSLKIDFGSRLADGLETRVGRNGIKLSGGEGQRLMIGAAAVKRPRFMIIDEATSNLDSSTEKAVQAGLAEVLAGGTSALVVAHRLSTVRNLCTKFIVLRGAEEANGDPQIEAIGSSFEELFTASPTFARLAEDQGIAK